MNRTIFKISVAVVTCLAMLSTVDADPCGMVPPIYVGDQSPITRIGLQKTYVFHKDGVETFVIRPGFRGNVDNFGMLIPFPNPPELRKVSDHIFDHIANAVDPPEVVVDLRFRLGDYSGSVGPIAATADGLAFDDASERVTVLKQEAVGMYEVAVLEAGSAAALKKWMDNNGYQYPEGMDAVTNDYVDIGWCFVAVKTKVGQQAGVDPKPGQRKVKPDLPTGSVFDGTVQGMGFRFKSDELVVPMRLSAFNEGELRNVVYLLTDGPRKIRSIPEEYVVRQVSGKQLFDNVTKPLPLRIIGGREQDIPLRQRRSLPARRNPEPKNGVAKDLFAADSLAVSTGNLSLKHEEQEKELLRIGEHFGLRGVEVDKENSLALAGARSKTVDQGLEMLKSMTLTVVDGDFPREVIARENLTFVKYEMPASRNDTLNYDANQFGPGQKKEGILKVGGVDWYNVRQQIVREHYYTRIILWVLIAFGLIGMVVTLVHRRPKLVLCVAVLIGLMAGSAFAIQPSRQDESLQQLLGDLEDSKTAKTAIASISAWANEHPEKRGHVIYCLLHVVNTDESLPKRGWAIAALAEIGGQDVDEYLLNVHADDKQKQIVRTWAAAGRVSMTRSVNGLIEKAYLVQQFPALGRPIGLRIVEQLTEDSSKADPEKVLEVTQTVPQLQVALAPMIMAFGAEKLSSVMIHADAQMVRRNAAAYLGSLAQQGDSDKVAEVVTAILKFDGAVDDVPWSGGPLFVPSINWSKEDARSLVGQLIRWNLWCDINGKSQEQKQIHNNIRSLGLARAAGYQSPGWNEASCAAWLQTWGAAVGRDEIEAILKEQDVEENAEYAAVLNNLN